MSKFFHTDRLLIRPRVKSDIDECLAMDRDPEVTKYIQGPWDNPAEHRAFLEERMAHTHPHPFGYWAITEVNRPNIFLGWIMILLSSDFSKAEIGWRLTRNAWGKGLATEAVGSVISLAFKHRPDIQIFASIHSENIGSLKVAQKSGMKFRHEAKTDGACEQFFTLKRS